MTITCDIAIIGGGLNGPALALALAKTGLSISIIDSIPRPKRAARDFDGRAYALSLATRRMLQALGVWTDVAAHSQPILDIVASDGRPGEGAAPWFLHFDHRELEEGPMGHMVEDRFLRPALLDALDAHRNIRQLSGKTVSSQNIASDHVDLTLDGAEDINAKLAVGCDGRHSATARRSGIARMGWGYDQTALVCAVAHEKPHLGVAHQFFAPSGPLGILPLPGNRSSIVWVESCERAAEVAQLPDGEFVEALKPVFGEFLGDITLDGTRFTYPLQLSLARRFVADRVALVGDAAHGIHPLAGQGLNIGLRDVAALAEVIVTAIRRGEDFAAADVLARYQQWRRFDVTSMAAATDGINRLFSNDNTPIRWGRDLGLGMFNKWPGARRALMRSAAGLTGDLPMLLQGRQI